MKFENLAKEVQDKIMSRFANWGINGKEAFENPDIFPEEFMQLEPAEMLKILDLKQISHKYSRSNYPELESDINNVILEDIKENQDRQKTTMTSEEEEASMQDFLEDIKDGDIDDDGNIDIENLLEKADNNEAILDIIGLSLPIGMIMSGVQVFGKIKSDEIVLNQAPKLFMLETGKKSVRVAAIGTMLASGSPVIVSSTVGYIIYKSRNLLEKISKGIFRVLTSDVTKNIVKGSGKAIIETGSLTGKTIKYTAIKGYNFITHDTTKTVAIGVAKGSHKVGKFIFNRGFNTIKATGKSVYSIIKNRGITIICENCGESQKIKRPSSSEIYFNCKKCYFMYPIELK